MSLLSLPSSFFSPSFDLQKAGAVADKFRGDAHCFVNKVFKQYERTKDPERLFTNRHRLSLAVTAAVAVIFTATWYALSPAGNLIPNHPPVEVKQPVSEKRGPSAAEKRGAFVNSRSGYSFLDSTLTCLASLAIGVSIANQVGLLRSAVKAKKDNLSMDPMWSRLWPATGAFAGTVYGALSNYATNETVHGVGAGFCEELKRNSFATAINLAKQWEIKTFAVLTPFILVIGTVAYDALQKPKKAPSDRLLKNLPKVIFKKDVLITATLTGISILANHLLGHYLPIGFDASGHVMMKSAATYGLITACEKMRSSGHNKAAFVAGAVVGATDALFMANTAACFHSVAEVVAGGVAAIAIKLGTDKIVSVFSRFFPSLQ